MIRAFLLTAHRPTLLCLLAAITIITGSYPSAASGNVEWYGAVKASISEDTIDSIKTRGIGTGEIILGEVDGVLEDDNIDDHTAGFALAVGRRAGYWNLELEYTYRYRTDWDIASRTLSLGSITNVFSNVESHSLLLNAARRGPINRDWSWEVGAGLGLVMKDVDSAYIERATETEPEHIFRDTSSANDFSYSAFAGVTRDLGNPWTLNMRLRYIDLNDLEAGPFPMRAAKVTADQSAFELQFSLERDF